MVKCMDCVNKFLTSQEFIWVHYNFYVKID